MRTSIRPAAAAAALLVAATGLTGCALFGPGAVRDGGTGEVTAGGQLDAFALRVGDCFNDAAGEEFEALEVVPCADPHDNELFFEFSFPDGPYPTEDEFTAATIERCDPAFAEFVGTDYDASSLDYWWITPTAAGWDEIDDRVVQCAVWDPAGRVSGSVRQSGR